MPGLKNFYQFYPQLVTLVGTKVGKKVNYMAAAWFSGISREPALIGVSIAPKRFTHDLLLESKEFNCNFLGFQNLQIVHGCGKTSGKNMDKIDFFEIPIKTGEKIQVPYIEKAYAVLECKLYDYTTSGDHTWIVGEVVNAITKEEAFTPDGFLDINKIQPVLYLGKNRYITLQADSYKLMPDKLT